MNIKEKIPGYNNLVLPYHFVKSYYSATRYNFPGKRLRVIGVTGTNGKTTTSFMIWQMLNHSGRKTGLMTTVAWGVPGLKPSALQKSHIKADEYPDKFGLIKQVEHMTTVDPITLNRRIKAIADSGAEFLVLEVTSHALTQFRTIGIPIEIAVVTNVTHEHLDYHKTFDNYVAAKTKLFKQAKFGIINADDPSALKFKEALRYQPSTSNSTLKVGKNYTSYGIKSGDFRAKDLILTSKGVNYSLHDINSTQKSPKPLQIKTQIPGRFNVYNSMAAALVGKKLGLTDKQISDGIFSLSEVEGRMNRLSLGQNFEVIVDFAHTPDAFEKVFSSVSAPAKGGRIISLFGGAGRRDKTTRAERGEIAGKYSDIVIITEDDPRDEDPEEIADMFIEGCKKAGLKNNQIAVELDRKKAINLAIKLAKKGDLVLILGKGHEKTILRADGPHPFEDLKVTADAIRSLMNK